MHRLLIGAGIVHLAVCCLPGWAGGPTADRELISEIGSEAATAGAGGKIVTFDGRTHVVWQDVTAQGYFNRVRSYDHRKGTWSEPFTLNQGKDNHARPVIMVDRHAFLHAIMSGHNSPVTYRRSAQPNDATVWTDEEPAGSGTYPVVTCGAEGTLYLTLRSSQRWNGVDLYVKSSDAPWRQRSKLILRDPDLPGYAGYQDGLAWGPDHKTLHFVVDFYESKEVWKLRGVHQAVCYMRSRDGGQTWERANGTPVSLPARPEQMDILVQSRGERHEMLPPPVILAQGSIAVDAQDRPHVIYISHLDQPGEVIHATIDNRGQWQRSPIDVLTRSYPDHRPVGCRGSWTIDEGGTLYGLLDLVPFPEGWVEGKPSREMKFEAEQKKVVWLVSRDGGKSFSVSPALEDGRACHEPNVERPSGFNQMAAGQFPPFLYFDGIRRYPEKGEILQNNVYFVRTK